MSHLGGPELTIRALAGSNESPYRSNMGAHVRGPVLATVVLLALAAIFAGGSDGLRPPGGIHLPGLHQRASETTQAPSDRQADRRSSGDERQSPSRPTSSVGSDLRTLDRDLFLLALAVAFLVAVVTTLRFGLVRRRDRHRVRPSPLLAGAPAPDDDVDRVTDALERGLAELDEGSVRNAVVAAWIRLERHVERAGTVRHPEDTPAEFVARASAALDPTALTQLADLYREARFSQHPIGEEQRDAARACLVRLIDRHPAGAPS